MLLYFYTFHFFHISISALLIQYYTPHCTLFSANQHLLEQPQFFTECDNRSFSYYLSPNIWNNLLLEIRFSPTLNAFNQMSPQT